MGHDQGDKYGNTILSGSFDQGRTMATLLSGSFDQRGSMAILLSGSFDQGGSMPTLYQMGHLIKGIRMIIILLSKVI